jgi:hypothetical protein
MEAFKIKFEKLNEEKKRRILTRFIEKNKGDNSLRVELAQARKMLSKKIIVV